MVTITCQRLAAIAANQQNTSNPVTSLKVLHDLIQFIKQMQQVR
jgi:hypothetical protein